MTQKRYITLQGDPVDGNLVTKFMNAADFPAAIGQVGLTYVFQDAIKSAKPPKAGAPEPDLVLNAGVHTLVDLVVFRYLEKFQASRSKLQGKCIDTNPDQDTAPTTAKYGLVAQEMRDWHKSMIVLCGAMDTAFIAFNAFADPPNFGPYMMSQITRSLVFYTRMASGFNRFNKVANGDWHIVDMPTPEKLAEAAKTPEKKRGFSLFPKPA